MLVGSKCDLEEDRKVSYDEGLKLAQEYNIMFYETSAKEDINISSLFKDIAKCWKEKADKSLILANWYKSPKVVQLYAQNTQNTQNNANRYSWSNC